jgi:hypothetical protein
VSAPRRRAALRLSTVLNKQFRCGHCTMHTVSEIVAGLSERITVKEVAWHVLYRIPDLRTPTQHRRPATRQPASTKRRRNQIVWVGSCQLQGLRKGVASGRDVRTPGGGFSPPCSPLRCPAKVDQ